MKSLGSRCSLPLSVVIEGGNDVSKQIRLFSRASSSEIDFCQSTFIQGVPSMGLTVYLSGEIHTGWRDEITSGCRRRNLDVTFTSPVTDHEASDAAGDHLHQSGIPFWRDHVSAKLNAIRTKTLIEMSDLVVIRFGDTYKQWNAAFDAGYCAALGTPYITLHGENIIHPLKEVDAAAMAWATTTEQVIESIAYLLRDGAQY
jgi:YtoQ family protein